MDDEIEEINKDEFQSAINIKDEEIITKSEVNETQDSIKSSQEINNMTPISDSLDQQYQENKDIDAIKEKENLQKVDIKENETNNKDDLPKFYDDLKMVIKTQENILISTLMAKEKIKYANEISLDQLKNFKDNSQKYGKYMKLIHDELNQISDLMKKIKKEIK
jgi:hypothetical protein